jgi:hypothetical protein
MRATKHKPSGLPQPEVVALAEELQAIVAAREITWTALASEAGIQSAKTLENIRNQKRASTSTIRKLRAWLAQREASRPNPRPDEMQEMLAWWKEHGHLLRDPGVLDALRRLAKQSDDRIITLQGDHPLVVEKSEAADRGETTPETPEEAALKKRSHRRRD